VTCSTEFISTTLPQRLGKLVKDAAAAEPPLAEDVVAASITQLFYDLDVEMIKTTASPR
jgi:hypothetical protein